MALEGSTGQLQVPTTLFLRTDNPPATNHSKIRWGGGSLTSRFEYDGFKKSLLMLGTESLSVKS